MNKLKFVFRLFTLLFIFAIQPVAADIELGLFAHFPLDGDATDATGNGFDGTVTGTTPTNNRFGDPASALFFNGTGDKVVTNLNMQDHFSGGSPLTFSLWFQTIQITTQAVMLGGNGPGPSFAAGQVGGLAFVRLYAGSVPSSDHAVNDGNWHHIVWGTDGSSTNFFIDGVRQSEALVAGGDIRDYITFGVIRNSEARYKGSIDDVRIYNRGLSESEIDQLFNEGSNQAPTADAGPDQSIRLGETVDLDGSASFDDNTSSGSLIYAWSLSSVPSGSSAILSGASTVNPSFVADIQGIFKVQLIVTDEGGLISSADEVEISNDNLGPIANVGSDKLVLVGTATILDGSGSVDPEGDPLTFFWVINSAPLGSAATISNFDMATAELIPDLEGVYMVTLMVSDPIGPGTPDSLEITAVTAADFAENRILCACNSVTSLSPSQVTSEGNKNAFLRHCSIAVQKLQQGKLTITIDKLEKNIIRTDGCEVNGIPDGNGPGRDWITDCNAQSPILICLREAVEALTP